MNRAVPLIFTGIGVVGLTLGGIYLTSEKEYELISEEISRGLRDFGDSNGGKCVKETFPNIEDMKWESVDDIGEKEQISSGFFGEGEMDGCLAIQWNKQKYTNEDNKWRGNFRLVWSVKEGDKGFVVFATAEGKEKEKEKIKVLEWSGAAYELTRESKNKPWGKTRKLVIEKKDQNRGDVADKFPKVGKFMAIAPKHSFWDFIDVPNGDKNEVDSICGSEECQSDNRESIEFRGYWTLESSGEDSDKRALGDWSSGLDGWWQDLFREDKWNMKEVIKGKNVKWNNIAAEKSSNKSEITIYTGE